MVTLQTAKFAPLILRVGLALVFFWFGTQQLAHPAFWVGFIPMWTDNPFLSPETLVVMNGVLETLAALLLCVGVLVRPLGYLLALHLFLIAFEAGGAVGVRDFGLGIAATVLGMLDADPWRLSHYMQKKSRATVQI